MGGYGSGRKRERLWVEDCLAIDVRWLARQQLLHLGTVTNFSWTRQDHTTQEDRIIGSMGLTVSATPALTLQFRWTHTPAGRQPENVEATVAIAYTDCGLGGSRPWFLCAGRQHRVAVLYVLGWRLECRHCAGLVYRSKSESRYDRALSRSTKLRKRIGATPGPANSLPFKPKRMHWRTFQRELAKLRAVEDVFYEESIKTLQRLLRNFG